MWGIVYKLQECSLPPRQYLVFRLWLWQAANVAVPQCLKKWSEAPIILLNFSWKLSASLVDTILENLCNQKQSILMVLDLWKHQRGACPWHSKIQWFCSQFHVVRKSTPPIAWWYTAKVWAIWRFGSKEEFSTTSSQQGFLSEFSSPLFFCVFEKQNLWILALAMAAALKPVDTLFVCLSQRRRGWK